MPALYPVQLKLTRTPLAGGAATVIEETFLTKHRRIQRLEAHLTQSIGNQGMNLVLNNLGRTFDSWESGDVVRVEAKRPQDATYNVVGEGFLHDPVDSGTRTPTLSFSVVGLMAVLDRINLTADHSYDAQAWTTVYDDLATTYLTGYTRTITADAATCGPITFKAGTKLREALDIIRRALLAETGSRWEHTVSKDDATKEIKLFKRDATVLRTIKAADLVQVPERRRGSAFDVINKVDVYGATVPTQTVDKTGLAITNHIFLDATGDWAAQPFTALDTPLHAHTIYAGRSSLYDPPDLRGHVARNSDNYEYGRRCISVIYGATITGAWYNANINDLDDATKGPTQTVFGGTGESEKLKWDFGAGVTKTVRFLLLNWGGGDSVPRAHFYGSNDNTNWTLLIGNIAPNDPYAATNIVASPAAYRYYKLTVSRAAGNNTTSVGVFEAALHEFYNNPGADTTQPLTIHYDDATDAEMTGTTHTGNATKVVVKYDLNTAERIAKVVLKHRESPVASSLINLFLQWSDNDTDWTDAIQFTSTTSTVTDTAYLEAGSHRYWRLIIRDERTAGSTSTTFNAFKCDFFKHLPYTGGHSRNQPLVGDELEGSAWTWGVANLVVQPAVFEDQEWPAPRLALEVGMPYWFVYAPQTGAAATKYWKVFYGTVAGAVAAVSSANSGASWGAIAADACLLHYHAFNNAPLVGSAQDAASQAKYANVVPGGILYAAINDHSLTTQELVDKEAAAIIAAKKAVAETIVAAVPYDPSLVPGKRVTLAADLRPLLGTSGDKDIVEATHDFSGTAVTVLTLGEHPPEDALGATISLASERTA